MTDADCRGVLGGPSCGRAPGAGRSISLARTRLAAGDHYAPSMTTETTTTTRWICESCGFIYDPDDGDPDGGIPPGTAFDDIPDSWFCPVCGARKRDFTPYED